MKIKLSELKRIIREEACKSINEQSLEPRLHSNDLDFLPELILQTAIDGLHRTLSNELKREYNKYWTMDPSVTVVGKKAFVKVYDEAGNEHSYKIELTKASK